jgi:hypothetical protein
VDDDVELHEIRAAAKRRPRTLLRVERQAQQDDRKNGNGRTSDRTMSGHEGPRSVAPGSAGRNGHV